MAVKLLYIDACPRPEGISRTRALSDAFLSAFTHTYPAAQLVRHDVAAMGLAALDTASLQRREALIDMRAWEDGMFAAARAFCTADAIVVAAPYWDLMFPAMLKVYIEHVFIRDLTFHYVADKPIGLCWAKRALFLTTAGSPLGAQDFGTDYLRAAFAMLGIPRFDGIAAEGLDMEGADVQAIMAEASARAAAIATTFGETED